MELKLHANATTTPRTRAYIQQSRAPVAALARELGVSETTIRRWRGRRTVTDRSHTPRRLATSLSLVEEALVCELRARLGLPLDDIAEVMRRCVRIGLSRSAIHRCLVRHGLNRRPVADKPRPGVFEPATLGFIHVDLKHLTRLAGRPSFVFVAIDRATRFVHIAIVARRDAATIAACLERFIATFPHEIHTVLTDNGSEFTDRFGDARWRSRRSGTGRHPFDRVCASHGIEHRLTRPFHPQTNGLVERFNRRLAQAIHDKPGLATNEGKNKFHSHAERDAFLHAFVHDYNRTRLKCLDYHAPLDLLTNQPGPNTSARTNGKKARAKAALDAMPYDIRARFQRIVELIRSQGLERVREPYVRHLEGPVWDMRMKGRDGIARAAYVTAAGRRVVVVHVFIKKTQRTPRRDIETALARAKEVE